MKGFLLKKKNKGSWGFKLRWCCIHENLLEYSEDIKDPLKGTLNLFDATEIRPNPIKPQFDLLSDEWAYTFEAASELERDAWVSHLEVWIAAKSFDDPIPIPRTLSDGLLAALEYCTFYAADVEGLFRVPGNDSIVKDIVFGIRRLGPLLFTEPPHTFGGLGYICSHEEIKSCLKGPQSLFGTFVPQNSSQTDEVEDEGKRMHIFEPFDVSSAIKAILKHLPETLLTTALFDRFMEAQDASSYAEIVLKLPIENRKILQGIMELTLLMWQSQETSNMDPGNVAVCLGPNLLRRGQIGFCDFSFMFFEMCQNMEIVFGEESLKRIFPEDTWDYLNELEMAHALSSQEEEEKI